MALGKLLEGAVWFAMLSLATAGTLTFVPDGAWETFPTALSPVRAKLAEFGLAPTCYRANFDAEIDAEKGDKAELAANRFSEQEASGGKIGETGKVGNGKKGETAVRAEDVWQASANVKIGERWKEVRKIEETNFVDNRLDNRLENAPLGQETEMGTSRDEATTETTAPSEIAAFGKSEGTDGSNAETPVVDAPFEPLENATADESWGVDAIPPFVVDEAGVPETGVETELANAENGTILPVFENIESRDVISGSNGESTLPNVEVGVLDGGNAELGVDPGTATDVDATNVADFNGGNDSNGGNATPGAADGLLERADAALPNDKSGAEAAVATPTPLDEAAELRDALAAASVASTPKEIKTVFETLSRIRDERGRRLAAEDSQALDAALDRLAFDVFYNPAQTILEPRWQTAPGESLASIAERLGTTPETLAEINGIKTSVGAPLPVGTTLKTVRGPVSAEISIGKRELTLRFNGLYAGRFALGVPENAANLRGAFRVVEKLENPSCDAVDANGQTISIPGGAPENPLGVAWIALDGGVGLQGTNRPELVGRAVPENGGFVFSNREIAQLSLLLPVGAVVAVVD